MLNKLTKIWHDTPELYKSLQYNIKKKLIQPLSENNGVVRKIEQFIQNSYDIDPLISVRERLVEQNIVSE